ncbi:MAG TPA: GIY-YIG nuclease family protein [Gemmataceae bacterium]|nr:GIY-YIG nuclease family protein [Gemmataceae bacterium]
MEDERTTFWVYILENPLGKFYIGSTDNPQRRECEHNDAGFGRVTYTHKNGPWRLVWKEAHPSRSAAVSRERQIKRMKSAKWIRAHLLNGAVPTRRD